MRILRPVRELVIDSVKLWLELLKIMVPVIIGVKLFTELGLIKHLAVPFAPVMKLCGLPAETGLVWATAILNNLYAAIVVYLTLLPEMPTLSVAQVTVLCTMMLIAHNLLVEGRIVQKCGASFWGQLLFRLISGLICGMILHLVFSGFGLLSGPSMVLWKGQTQSLSLAAWVWSQCRNFLFILAVITALFGLMRLLNHLKITDLLIKILHPVLRVIGVGKEAATITIIGLTMGLAYGGGLIIHQAKNGRLEKGDIFAACSLMGLSHAIIEDTVLMLLVGASIYGVFWARLLFTLAVMALLTRLVLRTHAR